MTGVSVDQARAWSTYQQAIFAHVEGDPRHLVVEAVAGSGKTTTMVEATEYGRGKKLVVAFNKTIAMELDRRSKGRYEAKTLHALGMTCVRRAFGDFLVAEDKGKKIAEALCREAGLVFRKVVQGREVEVVVGAAKVARLAALAKNTLTDETDLAGLDRLAVAYDIDEEQTLGREQLPRLAGEALRRAAEDRSTIDFDDMVWFPARHGLRAQFWDLVVVDETQDMNAAQLYLAQAALKKSGKLVAVGDRRQAIYGFRGADSAAMDRIKAALNADELPLSISYRCPRSVARLAQEIVPHFQYSPGAPEGSVQGMTEEEMVAQATPGDLVVSRKKAPLVRLCIAVLRRGVPACVLGRDIGKRVLEIAEKAKSESTRDILAHVAAWATKQAEKHGEEHPEKVEEANDMEALLEALCEECETMGELRAKVERLFRDDDPHARVAFATTHKAKGLERDRVWMLGDTYRVWPGPQWEEERNLYYVAVTRAKRDLRIVGEVRR